MVAAVKISHPNVHVHRSVARIEGGAYEKFICRLLGVQHTFKLSMFMLINSLVGGNNLEDNTVHTVINKFRSEGGVHTYPACTPGT